MYSRILIAGVDLPTYGVLILLGVVLTNMLAFIVAIKRKISFEKFLYMELIGGLSAFVGAKCWYALEHIPISEITIDKIIEGGLSFYGAFAVGIIVIMLICKTGRIDSRLYATNFIFLVPFLHMIWKIGCFMAGCCYGIRYEGPFAVQFPEESYGLSGVSLFPVQLLEAGLLGVLSIIFYYKGKKMELRNPIKSYVFAYGCIRFVVEFFRNHGTESVISRAHIVSVICILGAGGYIYYTRNSRKHGREET